MIVDRTTFLLLTGVIAAGAACTTAKTDGSDAGASSGGPATDAASDVSTADAADAADAANADAADGEGGTCNDDVGTPGDCTTATCSNFGKCDAYKVNFKPKVAAAAVACIKALPGGASCDALLVYGCGNDALKAACPDATVTALCTAMQTKCTATSNPIPAGECEQYANGLNAAGRTALQACDCQFGIYSCIEGL
jgi:hypothetical protein